MLLLWLLDVHILRQGSAFSISCTDKSTANTVSFLTCKLDLDFTSPVINLSKLDDHSTFGVEGMSSYTVLYHLLQFFFIDIWFMYTTIKISLNPQYFCSRTTITITWLLNNFNIPIRNLTLIFYQIISHSSCFKAVSNNSCICLHGFV